MSRYRDVRVQVPNRPEGVSITSAAKAPRSNALAILAVVAGEVASCVLNFKSFELLLGGNLTGSGLVDAASRAAGFSNGIIALVAAIFLGVALIVASWLAGQSRKPLIPLVICGVICAIAFAARLVGTYTSMSLQHQDDTIRSQVISEATTNELVAALVFAFATALAMVVTIYATYTITKWNRRSKAHAQHLTARSQLMEQRAADEAYICAHENEQVDYTPLVEAYAECLGKIESNVDYTDRYMEQYVDHLRENTHRVFVARTPAAANQTSAAANQTLANWATSTGDPARREQTRSLDRVSAPVDRDNVVAFAEREAN